MNQFLRSCREALLIVGLACAGSPRAVSAVPGVVGAHVSPGGAALTGQPSQFSYQYKTEIAFGRAPACQLSPLVEAAAKHLHRHLNISPYFDTTFVGKPKQVRKHHLKAKPYKRNVGKLVDIKTEDGYTVRCTYFDRGSDKLVIVGEGFTNERETMTPFVEMFDTDVVLFDFRGQGFESSDWSIDLAKHTFGVDSHHATIGVSEHFDVFAVVDHFRQHKTYSQVCGVSVCYASFIFLKAEGMRPGLFDRVVVDGCWESVPKLVAKLKRDPKMLCNPQSGGWGNSWLWSKPWAQDALEWLVRNIWNLSIDVNISLLTYLANITETPIMFFYGKDDLMVYREEFEELWQALPTPYKVGVVTSNPHVRNHLKQKELYKLLCELFFQCDMEEFRRRVESDEALVNYCLEGLSSGLKNAILAQDPGS